MATIRDLAARTGFSPATISRVLNNDPSMSATDETRAKILEAAKELHYTSSRPRKAPTPRPLHIAIVEMLSRSEQLRDPYYLYLKDYAVTCCMEWGYNVTYIYEVDGKYQFPTPITLDGILAIGIFSTRQIEALSGIGKPIVFLDSAPDELRFDSVVLNFRLGIDSAIDYLIRCGHRRIGFLGPTYKLDQRRNPAPEVRRDCYIDQMKRVGLFDESLLLDTKLTPDGTRQAVLDWLGASPAMPAAFIAYNEDTAITAASTIREQGYSIPGDVSLISFNDTPLSVLIDPPLTSINAHLDSMGEAAVRLLTERIEEPSRLTCKMVVPMTLTVRESVARFDAPPEA